MASEKDRQLDNLKQQSQYHLLKKTEEIALLKGQLEQLKAESDAQIQCLEVGPRSGEILRDLWLP